MASRKRTTKIIKDPELIKLIVDSRPKDITSTFVVELFGEFDGVTKANPYDVITLPPRTYGIPGSKRGVNIKPFTTTVGKLVFNRMFIEANPSIYEYVGWFDKPVTKKNFNGLYKELGYKKLEGEIELEDYKRFVMTTQLTMPYIQFIAESYTDEMLLCSTKINKKKAELLKKNKAAIDAKDIKVADEIQSELLDYAREIMADDPSMDSFNSGGGGDFNNHFKNMFVMKGTVRDPDPNKGFNIITSNYIDGVSAEEYADLANTLAEGPFNRAKKTEVGGWWEKLFVYSYQHLQLYEEGSNCGTKRFITITITKDNIDDLMYNYVIEGGKFVEITSKNRDSFIGKTVKMRFSSMCEAKNGFCNKCAGNLWYRLGIRKIGMITPQIPSKLKNLMMASFHDSQVRLIDMDVMEAFCPDQVGA